MPAVKFYMHLHNAAAQRNSKVVVQSVQDIRSGPQNKETWTCIIVVNNFVFQESGSTKQQARDLASLQALEAIGIETRFLHD